MATTTKRSPLLELLFRGAETTDSILIQDSVDVGGQSLFKTLVYQFAQHSSVHLFLFESNHDDWSQGVPAGLTKRLIFHDYYTDPLGWNADISTTAGDSPSTGRVPNFSIEHCVDQLGGQGRVVAFDCLSPLLLHHSGAVVARLLHRLGSHCSLMMSLVHTDLHEDHVISQLSHVTSTIITMQTFPPRTSANNNHLCSLHHKRKSGKVSKQVELFSLSSSYSGLSSAIFEASQVSHTDSEPDPTANLTFDLTLTAKEKRDRANVVLPYTRPLVSAQKGVGQIFYQPDEVDDFDESDPDDDLDI